MAVRVGVISDTHDVICDEVIDILKSCDYILHAGDVTEERVLDRIRFLGRLYVVRGNSDGAWAGKIKRKLAFQIEGVRFLMVHNRRDLGSDVDRADVIVYGHTHHYHEEKREGKLWLNPGSCGISRFGGELTCAVMEIDGEEYTVEKIVLS